MPKQLNSFVLPDNVIKDMKGKIKETKKVRVELGFGLCKDKDSNVIKKGTECTGTKCRIKVGQCLGEGQASIGDYHTHPRAHATMSISDMVTGCLDDIECIGSAPFNNIKCFIRKTEKSQCSNEMSPFEEEEYRLLEKGSELITSLKNPISTIRKGVINFLREAHQYDVDIAKYHQNRYRLLTKNFDTVDIK